MHVARLGDRTLFPSLTDRVYLNHAAISPVSAPVRERMMEVIDDYATRGVAAVHTWIEQRGRLRHVLAQLVNADASDIGYVLNTTSGIIRASMTLPFEAGDRVVLFRGEFPSNTTPWLQAAAHFGLEVVWLDADAMGTPEGVEAFESLLTSGDIRLVAASAVQFQTGLLMPLAKMGQVCHEHGTWFFVDAIQGAGCVPIDVKSMHIDILVCGGQKWLMGMEGGAWMMIAKDILPQLKPVMAGWLSHEAPLDFLLNGERGLLDPFKPVRQSADAIEGGAQAAVVYAGLEVAVSLLLSIGVEHIYDHVLAYHDQLEPALVARGFKSMRHPQRVHQSGILSMETPSPVLDWHVGLAERGIATSTPDGLLRFAPHWPNAIAEVDMILDAVDALM